MPHHALEGRAVWLSAPSDVDLMDIEFLLKLEAHTDQAQDADSWIIGPPARLEGIARSIAGQSPASFRVVETGLTIGILVSVQDAEGALQSVQSAEDLPVVVIPAIVQS